MLLNRRKENKTGDLVGYCQDMPSFWYIEPVEVLYESTVFIT